VTTVEPCSVGGCPRARKAKGLCGTHWLRQRKHGDPNVVLTNRGLPPLLRFLMKVRISTPDECWEWLGGKKSSGEHRGYGQLWVDGAMRLAHRWFYEQLFGPVSPDLDLDHTCTRPSCVNPFHLEPVPHAINSRRGRSAVLNQERAAEIRVRHAAGETNKSALGRRFGVTHNTIRNVVNGESWA